MTCRGQCVGFKKGQQEGGGVILDSHCTPCFYGVGGGGLLVWNIKSFIKVGLKK